MKIKFVWQKKLKEDAIENKIKIEKLIKKNKGQNQKKNNLKKWYKNMKGQTWISRRKEKKKMSAMHRRFNDCTHRIWRKRRLRRTEWPDIIIFFYHGSQQHTLTTFYYFFWKYHSTIGMQALLQKNYFKIIN
jgi:hypothetical protein